jgi:hypothetical protein
MAYTVDPPPIPTRRSSPLATLRQLAQPQRKPAPCELCSAPIGDDHPHLLDLTSRKVICACQACGLLFSGKQNTAYRRIPGRVAYWPQFQMTDLQWSGLGIPISLAFFFHNTSAGRVMAMYPSPAGATESLLALDAWQDLLRENPVLRELEPDVETLLINRVGSTREYYLAPIDECYKLVGLIRTHWRGLSGGTEVWRHIGDFFRSLREHAEFSSGKKR